jgi:hypothetical protein
MRPWVRYGLVGGIIAGASTLTAKLVIVLLRPADLCHAGPGSLVLLSLGAIIILIWMGAAAGFATARRVGSIAQAMLSGVLVGVIAGCALLALIPFAATATQRLEALASQCPDGGSVSFGGSFNFGTPPPGFFTTSPPPGVFASPPTGFAGAVFAAVGALFTIGFGIGLAAGAAALAGLAGASRSRSARPLG